MTDDLAAVREVLADGIASPRWHKENGGVSLTVLLSESEAATLLSALDAFLAANKAGCEFGCGPTGEEYVTPGFTLIPVCPVHGWVCVLIEAVEAERDRWKQLAYIRSTAEARRDQIAEATRNLIDCVGTGNVYLAIQNAEAALAGGGHEPEQQDQKEQDLGGDRGRSPVVKGEEA